MTDRTFGRAMWDAGARTWSGDFAYGYLVEQLALFNRGVIDKTDLIDALNQAESHRNKFRDYLDRGMSTTAALEVLADLPEDGSTEPRSSVEGGVPLL